MKERWCKSCHTKVTTTLTWLGQQHMSSTTLSCLGAQVFYIVSHHIDKQQSTGCDDNPMTTTPSSHNVGYSFAIAREQKLWYYIDQRTMAMATCISQGDNDYDGNDDKSYQQQGLVRERMTISHCLTWWQQQQQHGCDNIICCQQAPRAFYILLLKQRQMARNFVQAHNIKILRRAMATSYHIASHDGNNDNNMTRTTSYVVNKPLFLLYWHCTVAMTTTTATTSYRTQAHDIIILYCVTWKQQQGYHSINGNNNNDSTKRPCALRQT